MASAIFKYSVDSDNGMVGWLLRGMEGTDFNPTDARGVAHDMLEHFPGDDDSVAAEFRAMGSFTFVRLESGHTWESDWKSIIGRDLGAVIRDYIEKHGALPSLPLTKSPLLDDYDFIEEQFLGSVDVAVQELKTEQQYTLRKELIADGIQLVLEQRNVIIALLRQGFRRAARRFRSTDYARMMFDDIVKLVEAESVDCREGDEIRVTVHPKAGEVFVNRINRIYY